MNYAVVPSFPFVTPRLVVLWRLRFGVADEGDHVCEVKVTDLDGRQGKPIRGEFSVTADSGDDYVWETAWTELRNFVFLRRGDTRFDLSVDGVDLASTLLYLRNPHERAPKIE